MADKQQTMLNAHFAEHQASVESRLRILEDAFIAMERTLNELLTELQEREVFGAEPFIGKWLEAIELLRTEGLPQRPMAGEVPTGGVTCPGCQSVLRNVTGAKGDRCDWCGYVFPLVCPGCNRELTGIEGQAGDTCLWCQHQF